MRKSSASLRDTAAYTSPGTPEYADNIAGGTPRGWNSERVALPANNSRRHSNGATLMPFYSGRALPSKWDDAERWITSPVSGNGVSKNFVSQYHQRPKSKSGPLGTPGFMYLPHYSPPMVSFKSGTGRNFIAGSPFTTGVLLPDGVSLQYGTFTAEKLNSLHAGNCMDQSTKGPQLLDLQSESSMPSSQDSKPAGEAETNVSRVVSRRDMATQMSPDGSIQSSPGRQLPCSTLVPPTPLAVEQHLNNYAKVEVRDVKVDKGTAVRRKCKNRGCRKTNRGLSEVQNAGLPWDVSQAGKDASKLQREEAKISAWENLQKAKAEAAIRKLEMKIEKRRSESMDKILNKLRGAQLKAQEMRSSIAGDHAYQKGSKRVAFFCRYVKVGSLRACFFCGGR